MARCAFEADAKDAALKRCPHCKRVLRSPHPPEKCHATCRACAVASPAPPKRKSLFALIAQFARAWWRYIRAGTPRVTTAERRARLTICQTCPHYQSRGVLASCRACGCFVRLKARWATEHCPRGKWPGDPPAPEPKQCGCAG